MTSIEEFRNYLQGEGRAVFSKIETAIRNLPFEKPELLLDLQALAAQELNNLYFEMLDFITWLEQEQKQVKSKTIRVLLDDLRKDSEVVRNFQHHLSTYSPQAAVYKNRELFAGMQHNLIKITRNLAAEIAQYLEELDWVEKELLNSIVIMKRIDNFLLQSDEVLTKVKLRIQASTLSTFPGQKLTFTSSLEYFTDELRDHYKRLQKLRKVSALPRVLAKLEIVMESITQLLRMIKKTNTSEWKDPAAFEVFKKRRLEELDAVIKTIAIIVQDLQDAQKQIAA